MHIRHPDPAHDAPHDAHEALVGAAHEEVFQVRGAVERGLSEDQTVAAVQMDDFSHFDRFGDWFELNVRGAYRIISGGM